MSNSDRIRAVKEALAALTYTEMVAVSEGVYADTISFNSVDIAQGLAKWANREYDE